YVATVVDAKVVDGTSRVLGVHTAVDAGFIANPERVRLQIRGAAVMGMTVALHSGINQVDGAVQEGNFDAYQIVRADNCPLQVYTHIVEHQI
ncbi:MAG: molybdopterin cofactor-binding domain-containing protein, partial [Rhizobiaceae bacterium]